MIITILLMYYVEANNSNREYAFTVTVITHTKVYGIPKVTKLANSLIKPCCKYIMVKLMHMVKVLNGCF